MQMGIISSGDSSKTRLLGVEMRDACSGGRSATEKRCMRPCRDAEDGAGESFSRGFNNLG
jgi:hypothetical protein